LDSLEYFYAGRKDLQIVIVDDQSNDENNPEVLVSTYADLQIKIIRIANKKGINPCYPINVGVRHSEGDIILLSSPEIIHTRNIFDHCKNFEKLTDSSYLQFSVFCLTSVEINKVLLDPIIEFDHKFRLVNSMNTEFHMGLGVRGYSYANVLGVWYTHGKIKNDCYNFLSACTRKTYYDISGFNEAFVKGTGYDDADFRDRLLKHINNNVIWYDDFVAIHIDHPSVSGNNNTNLALYNRLKDQVYKKNDDWGQL